MNVYRYWFGDAEIEVEGYLLAKDNEDAIVKARNICHIYDNGEDGDVEVTDVMEKSQLENLLITGHCQTFYDDWD